jgi:hypothetical protein
MTTVKRAQIEIGERAFEETFRLFDRMKDAANAIGVGNNATIYGWMRGDAPSAKYLQRLHYLGADVIYILTGVRRCDL